MLYRWDVWLAANGIELAELHYPVRYDRSSMSIELAKQGGGIALESVTLCLPELLRGELVPFAPELPVVEFPACWLVMPDRHHSRRSVQQFHAWITRTCREHEREARPFLSRSGCEFRPEDGSGLINAVWNVESAP